MAGYVVKDDIIKFDFFVQRIDPRAVLPSRKSPEAAGYDICTIDDFSLLPGERFVARTGLVVQPPPGFHTEILLRSGISFKYNIMLCNGVGLIDRDYAGENDELRIMLWRAPINITPAKGPRVVVHRDQEAAVFKCGDRLAQLVFRKTELFNCVEVDSPPSGVPRGGLGSTGL